MVGGRRRNPRARQGADVKIGPAAKSSSSRMLGSWLGIARSHRIRGWQGVRPCLLNRSSPRPQLALDLRALIRGFRAPACIAFSSERHRLRSPVAPVREALVRILTWPLTSAGKSKRPTFTAKAIAKYGRDCALPGFARALAACAG